MNRRALELGIAVIVSAVLGGLIAMSMVSSERAKHDRMYHPTNAVQCETSRMEWERLNPTKPWPLTVCPAP